jgi:hypothetical protein
MGQTLYPTAIVAKGGLGGLVTDIDDDPASPDGNWCTSGSFSTYSGSGAGTLAASTGSGFGTSGLVASVYNGYTPTIYAAPSALGNGSGSSEANAATLRDALDDAVAGSIIGVLDGTYSDSTATWYVAFNPANSGTSGSPVVIVAKNRHGATLQRYAAGLPAIQPWQRNYVIVDGFSIIGRAGLRGEATGENSTIGHHNQLVNLTIDEGDIEGDDASLNWGICLHSTNDSIVRNCKVAGMINRGNTSTNTAAIMLFGVSWRNTIEYCDADATNVHSAFGQKGGNLFESVWRYNVARNARDGDDGGSGCGYLGKGDTGGTSYCDDHEYYGNVAINCKDAFFLNHNSRRWLVYNNVAYNCDNFLRQWQLNSVDNDFFNNIMYDGTRAYDIEALTGDPPVFEPYIEYSDYNCFYSLTDFAQGAYGDQYATMASWTAAQSMDGNSTTSNPGFTNAAADDFTLDTGSPCIGTGRGGSWPSDMGAFGLGNTRVGTDF